MKKINAVELAGIFHHTYERLAPKYGYVTRMDTREFDVDSKNGRLMIEVCRNIIEYLTEENLNI